MATDDGVRGALEVIGQLDSALRAVVELDISGVEDAEAKRVIEAVQETALKGRKDLAVKRVDLQTAGVEIPF